MILTIIIFLVLLSVLVLVHEFGHFFTARRFGVGAEEFGLGFPPRVFGWQIWKERQVKKITESEKIEVALETEALIDNRELIKETIIEEKSEVDEVSWVRRFSFIKGNREITEEEQKHGTVYSFNLIPIGGFVKITGENGEDKTDPKSLVNKPIWKRATILSAGVIMNVILAAIIIITGLMLGLPQTIDDSTPLPKGATISNREIQILQILPKSPAEKAGLRPGDAIVAINNNKFTNYSLVQGFVADKAGQSLRYTIKRGQETINKDITPEIISETKKAGIGVSIAETGLIKFPWYQAILRGLELTGLLLWAIITGLIGLIGQLFAGKNVSASVAGPVGIATLTGQMAQLGFAYLLQFAALLSLNLAVINILPLPALDGGRILFLIIEKIKGTPVKQTTEAMIHNIGFMLLIGLVLLVTFKDIIKLF